ncbi:hypothetical protein [Streptomyces sp. BPTC-684]|uniref:hypothetical protein n=1 Tax=Streptomyces sp. BPTC-684 TaxID=3043734 RepID=UPI0024B0DF3F|nr:hypothetical protein [Streptomyces sp. BPTC-684]WHM40029.1 hypothetical protein QIY60_26355 [Streptomyces sp. BPTC-684]
MDDDMTHAALQKVWPFALTRSVNTGFRIVVAPDFLVDADRQFLLHDVADGDISDDVVYVREYQGHGSQRLWLLYRVVYLKASDVGLDGEYAMSGPRRTPLIEGVVCRRQPERPTTLATEELFADVHRSCGVAVREFFEADIVTHPVSRSQELSPPASGRSMPTVEQKPYLAEGSTPTTPEGRRPSGAHARFSATALRSAVSSAFGRGPGPASAGRAAGIRVDGPGRASAGRARPHHSSETGQPRRALGRQLVRAAAVIVLAVLVVFAIRKLK